MELSEKQRKGAHVYYSQTSLTAPPDSETDEEAEENNNKSINNESETKSSNGDSSRKRGISKILNKYADRGSMNAVPYIHNSKSITVKIFWSCLLVVAIGLMSIHLYRLVATYLAYKKQTLVKLSFNSLQFPAVTICNANPLRMSHKDLASPEFREYINKIDPVQLKALVKQWVPEYDDLDSELFDVFRIFDRKLNKSRKRKGKSYMEKRELRKINFFDGLALDMGEHERHAWKTAKSHFDEKDDTGSWHAESSESKFHEIEQVFRHYFVWESPEVRAKMGHQISDMLLQCSFSGGICEASNFTRVLTSKYGNCYTLQYPKFISRRSGPDSGLKLKLFLETDQYVPGIASSKGIQVVIHDQGTVPFPDEEGVAVRAGAETAVSLRRMQIERLGKPYGKCTPIEDFQKKYGIKYTRHACQRVCQETVIRERCGCHDLQNQELARHLKIPDHMKPCHTVEEHLCSMRVHAQFEEDLGCECYNPCSEISFKKTISSREWPTPEFSMLLRAAVCKHNMSSCRDLQRKNDNALRGEFIKLVIYYEDLNYEELEESASYVIYQFISDVGGAIGLWIGLSLLSMFEIVHLIWDVCLYICRRPRQKK